MTELSRPGDSGPAEEPLLSVNTKYFTFVREERQLCGVLAHLLLSNVDNVARLLELVNRELAKYSLPPYGQDFDLESMRQVEIYLEFAFLRDHWSQFDVDSPGEANRRKRRFIFELFSRNEVLCSIQPDSLSDSISEFNSAFMGPAGARWRTYIAQPGNWNVNALWEIAEKLRSSPDAARSVFFELCRFKWAFNIKPDMVLLFPSGRPLCIEAKLLSPESKYPSAPGECRTFDSAFGHGLGRTGQLEMQEVLFRTMLGVPAQQLVIAQASSAPLQIGQRGTADVVPVLAWTTLFESLDHSSSLRFVSQLVRHNTIVRNDRAPQSRGSDWDGEVAGLAGIISQVEQRLAQGKSTEVGYLVGNRGGDEALLQSPIDVVEARRSWKWRDPTKHGHGKNWIEGSRFLDVVETLRQATEAQPGTGVSAEPRMAPGKPWDGQVEGLTAVIELIERRATLGEHTAVGFQQAGKGGARLLRETPLAEIKQRVKWKWRDPLKYGPAAHWIDGPEFVQIVGEKEQRDQSIG